MMSPLTGALRRYAAARGDENIDYMVTRGRLERRERRMGRAGLDGDGGEPAAGFLSGMQHTVQIAPQHLLADVPGLSAQGAPVIVLARLGRWRCRNQQCDRRIFTERVPSLAAPFARRTATGGNRPAAWP